MKLKDIYTKLKKNIDLRKKNKKIKFKKSKLSRKNLEWITKKNLYIPNLSWNKVIKIEKKKKLKTEEIKKIWYLPKKINLYKKILKSKYLFSYSKQERIISYLKLKWMAFKEKNIIFKTISIFILIFLILFLNLNYVKYLTKSWLQNLISIKNTSNINQLEENINKASFDFSFANILFKPFPLIPSQKIDDAKNIIKVGYQTTILLDNSLSIFKNIKEYINNKKLDEIYFTNLLLNQKRNLINIEKNIEAILINSKKIKLETDIKNKEILNWNIKKLEIAKKYLSTINNNFETFLNIFWHKKRKKYLIVFQNNDEIRPTWGFMWSVWIIEIFRWKIEKFEKKDIYALEWDVKKNYYWKVKPITWVDLLSERLWLRDANSYIDFWKSSKAINYFMKKWWYDIDWIIYINQKLILEIIKEVWEVNFKKYNTKINNKNFSEIISLLVEAKVTKKATLDTPKQVLFDFSNILFEKINNKKNYFKVWKIILNNLISRDIVFYSFDKKENTFLNKLNISWKFDYKKQIDFIYPFFISVWWNKSDRFIKRKYSNKIIIKHNQNKLCNLKNKTTITLKNIFNKNDEKRIKNEMKKFNIKENKDLLNILWKWDNINYTKVIIPINAKLNKKELKSKWYIILNHWIYKTVEKLIKTKSWNENIFSFDYLIENIDCEKQNFKIYKQPGIYNYSVNFEYKNYYTKKSENINIDWLNKDFYYNTKNN